MDIVGFLDWKNKVTNKLNKMTIDRMINLIMCSGLNISRYLYRILCSKKEKTYVEL